MSLRIGPRVHAGASPVQDSTSVGPMSSSDSMRHNPVLRG